MEILLLEDNLSLNKAITKILELDLHKVSSFYDGKMARNSLNKEYDLYLLDINVPGINGLELLDFIYKRDNTSNVIMISSNTDLQSLQKAYALGCIDYLKKPFHLEELRLKISRLQIKTRTPSSQISLKDENSSLTKKERLLLDLLLEHSDTTVSYAMIDAKVYQNKMMSMDGLRALVRRLRSKLADDIVKNIIDEGYSVASNVDKNLRNNTQQRTHELEVANDILKQEKETLLKIASIDSLTGLYNRRTLEQEFILCLEKCTDVEDKLSLVMMDLDYFKRINDAYGHNVGDMFLKEIALILNTIFRKSDIIGRWGGEEFLILLPKTNIATATIIAQRVQQKIQSTLFEKIGKRTASFGVSSLLQDESFKSVVGRVDKALYLAKSRGRNRVEVF